MGDEDLSYLDTICTTVSFDSLDLLPKKVERYLFANSLR